MKFLVNCSNLKNGGGLQVADSLCRELYRYTQHRFVVVLSSGLGNLVDVLEYHNNVETVIYNLPHTFSTVILGRDKTLDNLSDKNNVDAVLTIFGPSLWQPRCPHLCGFARAQLLLTDSPYYKRIGIKEKLIYKIWAWGFLRSSKVFYTENPYISEMLPGLLGDVRVYSVTNYYNQVFDEPSQWKSSISLPEFDGITCLSVSSSAPHKNINILIDVSRYLMAAYPNFKCRYVLTFDKTEMPVPDDVSDKFLFIGKVGVSECPNLYKQADIMFMPTLMECFTATYPEAMRMEVPIVTTDLEFAHGLCGDAACYFSAVDAIAAAEAIYKVATDKEYAHKLIENGKEQLKQFDNYEQRADKIINILEEIS